VIKNLSALGSQVPDNEPNRELRADKYFFFFYLPFRTRMN
jgi:hypothetical protein